MNEHLQIILEVANNSATLRGEEKSLLLKAIKATDSELTIAQFKLDRTEKVKRTTAILLEETIEELEQKRKAVEKQAYEAKIEASLERVRLKAMAMNSSEELNEAVLAVFEGLDELGFETIRCGIGIFNDDTKKVNAWTISPKDDSTVSLSGDELLEGHPLLDGIYNAWSNQTDYSYKLTGKDLINYYELVGDSNLPVKPPDNIKKELVQNYHCVMFPAGGLYAFSENDFSEEAIGLMKKFRDVFHLAFTRHLDLKKAEAQAREAQVEASLERVRVSAMSMHKSEEVGAVSDVLFSELNKLKIDVSGCSIAVIDEEKDKIELWRARSDIVIKPFERASFNEFIDISKKYMPDWSIKFFNALDKRKGNLIDELSSKKRKQFINAIADQYDYSIEEKSKLLKNAPEKIVVSITFFKLGYLALLSEKKLSEENLAIARRFMEVFDFAYTRFLDINKAEAQAREAQIEASLEKVRSKAMGMHGSDDLALTIDHFFHELKNLNVKAIRCGVGIKVGDSRIVDVTVTSATENGDDIKLTGKLRLEGHPILDEIYESLKIEAEYFPVLKGKEIKEYYLAMNPDIEFPNFSEDDIQYGYYFHYKEGGLFAWTTNELLEEEINIFRRFKSVLSLTYRRYLDLKDAEAKTKEALIATGLERVRARTMAMHKSSELAQTASHLFEQLNELGVNHYRCNIAIVDVKGANCHLWSTTDSGNVIPTNSALPLTEYSVVQNMYDGWKTQKSNHVIKLVGKERLAWTKYISKYLHFDEYKPQNIKENLLFKEATFLSNLYFKQGFFTIYTKDELAEDDLKIIQRFAKVFEQTYTRFLDLENAEAQNKLIQAENERKTRELEEARELQLAMLPKELPQLPNIELAVYMQTATEVGGDYYDFHVSDEGILTGVIGDATGHGMKAGTIVTITKSLFNNLAPDENILNTFSKISKVIKEMKFRQLSMCLLMFKIEDNVISISSAAMPPTLIYRAKNNIVEEFELRGMPLGAMNNFPYKLVETTLHSGDTILLMSDGFPELMNQEKGMYGYDRTKSIFHSLGEKAPEEIVKQLKNSASNWINEGNPDDDVTFVVIKVK